MPFPQRNNESDQIAVTIFNSLLNNGIARGGAGRKFIAIVITGNPNLGAGEIYIATSGPPGGQLSNALNAHAGLTQEFTYTAAPIINADNIANIVGPGALPRPAGPYNLQNPPYGINGGRYCAEPKALIAAGQSPYQITAMSTIWWGNNNNPHPHAANQAADPTGLNAVGLFAAPCQICQSNEQYIMMRVTQTRNRARGANFHMESPF